MSTPLMLPSAVLILVQLIAVLAVTTICGFLAQRLRQPRVIGECVGGLVLGPLLLGRFFPAVFATLFPAAHLQAVEIISNVGLVLFLLLTGSELDVNSIKKNRGAALGVTLGNVGLPFLLGALLAPRLRTRFGMTHVSPAGFLLFTGIALSITALPLMARIIEERNAEGRPHRAIDTRVTAMSLVCAAASDFVAWALLAVAITLVHSHQAGHSLQMTCARLLLLIAYVAVMLMVVRPAIKRLVVMSRRHPRPWLWVPCVVAFAFLSAHITERFGVQAFVGAFLAGVCVPVTGRSGVAVGELVHGKLRPVVRLALPFFFAITGLRMQPNMFAHSSFRWFVPVLAVAVVGKICGALFPARAAGMSWKMAAQLGILMNTRGLVELVVVNVGLKEGVLSPLLFTLFVLMALVTTAMTVPFLDLLNLLPQRERRFLPQASPSTRS